MEVARQAGSQLARAPSLAATLSPSSRTLGLDERIVLSLLMGFALLARVTVALTVPLWQGPDEPKHFEYSRLLVDKRGQLLTERRLLWFDDASPTLQREIISSMARSGFWTILARPTPSPLPSRFDQVWGAGRHTQLHRPSLYYFVGAAALLILQPLQATQPVLAAEGDPVVTLEQQVVAVRLVSALLSALCVPVAYLAGRLASPTDRFVPTVAAAFVAALPMHVFVGGVVNNDNLAALVGSLLTLALVRGFCRGFGVGTWLVVLGLIALGIATKRTTVGLLPMALVAAALSIGALRGRRLLIAGLVGAASAGLGIATVATGLVERAVPVGRIRSLVVAYALNEPDQLDGLLRAPLGSTEAQALIAHQLDQMFRSFWGVFGWFSLHLSEGLYRALYVVSVVCALGFLVWLLARVAGAAREARSDGPPCAGTRAAPGAPPAAAEATKPARAEAHELPDVVSIGVGLVCVVAIAAMVALAVGERLAYMRMSEVPQGRYLFTTIVPISLVVALGARSVLPRRHLGTWLPSLACALALVLLDLGVYALYVVPFYSTRSF